MGSPAVVDAPRKKAISWDDVFTACQNIAASQEEHIDVVIGIHGGGTIPAAMVARCLKYNPNQLSWPRMATLRAQSMTGLTRRRAEFDIPAALDAYVEEYKAKAQGPINILVVDEIYDTGATMVDLRQRLKHRWLDDAKITYAALITKQANTPNFHALFSQPDVWWVFPWEDPDLD